MRKAIALIVDTDLNFAFWLGQALDAAGHHALPARSVSDARDLLKHLRVEVDLLIARCPMPGIASFIEGLLNRQKNLQVIGIVDNGEEGAGRAFTTMRAAYRWPGEEIPKTPRAAAIHACLAAYGRLMEEPYNGSLT